MASARGRSAGSERPIEFTSILQILDESAHDFGHDPATIFVHDDPQPIAESRTDSWNWCELRDRALSVAGELQATGVPMPGARILLVYPAGPGFLAAFLGCLYLGAVPVPVPAPRRSEGLNRWLHIARDAEVSGVLCAADASATFATLVDELGEGFCLAPAGADPQHSNVWPDGAVPVTYPGPEDLAFLQYTSGSTSEPKGVMVTHGGLMANLDQIRDGFGLSRADRMACWLPHYHDMGLVGCLLSAVYNGFPIALMAPASFLRRPSRYLALATHFGATIIGGPNFAYDHCVRKIADDERAKLDLSGVRVAFNGAETIRGDTLHRFHEVFSPNGFRWEAFLCCYGMAEATLYLSGNRPHDPPSLVSVDRGVLAAERRIVERAKGGLEAQSIDIVSCGRAADSLDIAIVDPVARKPLPDQEVGEIWVRGANLSGGYWDRAELNGEVFDQRLDGEPGWFRTGDLGFLHEAELFVTGRLKDMIVIRGQNHYPQDLERTASTCHPFLVEGMAGAFAMERDGEECVGLICEVSREALRALDAPELFAAIRGAVSREHDLQLSALALIKPGRLPRTPSGKVRRFECRERLLDGSLSAVAQWEADFVADEDRAQAGSRPIWLEELQVLPKARRAGVLRDRLRTEVSRLAGLSAGEVVSDDAGFFDLGLDSVAVVEIGAILERELGFEVEPTVMFEHPTLSRLVDYLIDNLGRPEPSTVAEDTGVSAQPQPAVGEESDMDAAIAAEISALRALLQPGSIGERHAQPASDDNRS
ncbi:AMP-binding protein [Aquamicrobium sp. LC103]|uniref:AMP-binding protein n=1 Tax=Aquamicrobium sp. LC103 TaxID=1120658 RepID=UPI001FEDF446|nr:AMP-binding protein [Aquamicrobium sp. LC103]